MTNSWDEREQDFEYKPVRQTAKGIGWTGVLIALAIVVFGGIGIAHWGFGVFTSDIKGQGDAVVVKNEAGNRIRAQEGFEGKIQAIMSMDKQINITADDLAKNPTNTMRNTELVGQKQFCASLVGEYNADARKFSKADFKAADLPDVIDDTKPETDCKENVK